MALPRDFLEQLHARNDIFEVIGSYVTLRRQGSRGLALCPFHNEKTASFTVYSDTQSFYCFGCGVGGDVISFIMREENLEYIEAVRLLAERTGLRMPEDAEGEDGIRRRRRALEANKAAARFYYETLNSEKGREARAYLRRRGLSDRTIKRFGIGYSPPEWDSLRNALNEKGYYDPELFAAGLLKRGKNGFYDTFRSRVMFPIIDIRGSVIAFGGRALESGPKYLNTPETDIFKKGRNLFALNIAKNSTETSKTGSGRTMILTEGYMDAIALHQAGFTNSVATLGTALTSDQAKLLSKYTDEVVMAYDADESGKKATGRAAEILRTANFKYIKVLGYEGAKDPDEFIRKFGAERFRMLLSGSDDAVRYELLTAKERYPMSVPEGLSGYIDEAAEIIARIKDKTAREAYADWLSGEIQGRVEKSSILNKIETISAAQGKKKRGELIREMANIPKQRGIPLSKRAEMGALNSERMILVILLRNPDMLEKADDALDSGNDFSEDIKPVYEGIKEVILNDEYTGMISLSGVLTGEQMSRIASMDANSRSVNFTEADMRYHIDIIKNSRNKLSKAEISEMDPERIRQSILETK